MGGIAEFSRTLAAHGLSLASQIAVVVAVVLWAVLAIRRPGRPPAMRALLPAFGEAERLALSEIGYMVAAVCAVILVALAVLLGGAAIARWWGVGRWEARRARTMKALDIPKTRPLSEGWKREKDREESRRRMDRGDE